MEAWISVLAGPWGAAPRRVWGQEQRWFWALPQLFVPSATPQRVGVRAERELPESLPCAGVRALPFNTLLPLAC